MKQGSLSWLLLFLLARSAPVLAQPQAAPAQEPSLQQGRLPARGIQSSLLTVPRFGRYAIRVVSPQGASLQLVDRMAGPGEIAGSPGKRDGRLDLFLDRGDYKLIVASPEKGSGEARLQAKAFVERNAPQPPLLVELKPVTATLDDFEQLSYWLEIQERRPVILEAAGRNLADLRLWKDGSWLVDAEPAREVVQPRVGKPIQICRLATTLEAGLYLLTAYGGVSQSWSEDSGEHPLDLRWGIPTRGLAARQRHTMSAFGSDRFLVLKEATYFRLEVPEARPATLQVTGFNAERPFEAGGRSATIAKNSLLPVAEVQVNARSDGYHLVTVMAEAGQPYALQHFELKWSYSFNGSGQYWLSTIHSGHPADSVDATAILFDWDTRGARGWQAMLAQSIELDSARGFHRRCNLLDPLTVHLQVLGGGRYVVAGAGVEARFRIEPFLITKPQQYEPPPFRESGATWELDAGFYVLTVEPVQKGIVDLTIRPAGLLSQVLERVGLGQPAQPTPVRAAVTFPQVNLVIDHHYTLYLNQQPGVKAGVILRRLPIDLTEPLAVTQQPGETLSIPVSIPEPGTLRAQAEDGSLLELSLDNGAWQRSQPVGPGAHSVSVRLTGTDTMVYSLDFAPLRLDTHAPLSPVSETALASLPQFPVLTEGAPQFFELGRGSSATFLVRADRPGLYRLETTGLLATEGNLRTRTITSLARQAANGVGRNFLIQSYLREGDYQISVRTQGQSAGHLGLRLDRTELVDGGALEEGLPARASLGAGQAVAYQFTLRQSGEYRLLGLGLGRSFNCRLEDADGWPIMAPHGQADLKLTVEASADSADLKRYRLILLPEALPTRRLTLLQRIPEPLRFEGHGPHVLPLDHVVEHQWLEPNQPGDAERAPDVWEFEVPASMEATVQLTGEMHGHIERVGEGAPARVAYVPPARGFKGELGPGRYRLSVTCVRRNNRVSYQVGVWARELVTGLERAVSAPTVIPVSVGKESLVEIGSFGSTDLRARLYDGSGRLLAESDDRPQDWNFQIAARLAAGKYSLRVDAVGPLALAGVNPAPAPQPPPREPEEEVELYEEEESEGESPYEETEPTAESPRPEPGAIPAPAEGSSRISMRIPEEIEEAPLSLPADNEVAPVGAVHLYPLKLPPGAELFLLSARSVESVGCSLEAFTVGSWTTVGTSVGNLARLEVPLARIPERRYRLRLWSLDRRGARVRLRATAVSPRRVAEPNLRKGLSLAPLAGWDPPLAVAAVTVERPGVFRLADSGAGVRYASSPDRPSQEASNETLTATGDTLWLIADQRSGRAGSRIRASRLFLPTGSEAGVPLHVPPGGPVLCDLAPAKSGPVLAVATSLADPPGIRVAGENDSSARSALSMALDPRSARASVSVSLASPRPVAVVWSGAERPGGPPAEIRLHHWRFAPPELERATWGVWSGSIRGLTARGFDLPEGMKQIRLAAGDATVAVLSSGETVESVHWAGGAPFEETIHQAATRLTLLHTREAEDRFTVEVLPADRPGGTLTPESPFEQFHPRAGTLRLSIAPVEAAQPRRVHVRGAVGEALLLGADGRIERGTDLELGSAGGTLVIPHAPGWLLGWISTDEASSGFWGAVEPGSKTPVEPPDSVRLEGRVKSIDVKAPGPVMLHLRTSAPVVTRLVRGAREAPEAEVHPAGAVLDAYLPEGEAELTLRALGGASLSGAAELTATVVTPIGEGLGPEVLLSAGSTRLFSFSVSRQGPAGIGVRADSDVVEAVLYDGRGKRLGTGVVQMPRLEPGTYLLALRVPRDAPTVRARPALAGIEPPDTGPPADVVRRYMDMAGAKPAPASKPEDERR